VLTGAELLDVEPATLFAIELTRILELLLRWSRRERVVLPQVKLSDCWLAVKLHEVFMLPAVELPTNYWPFPPVVPPPVPPPLVVPLAPVVPVAPPLVEVPPVEEPVVPPFEPLASPVVVAPALPVPLPEPVPLMSPAPAPVAVLSVPVLSAPPLVVVVPPLLLASVLWSLPQALSRQVPRARVSKEILTVCLRIKKTSREEIVTVRFTSDSQRVMMKKHVIMPKNP
jgi:hypothetical protein